jgi:hypothetical protein
MLSDASEPRSPAFHALHGDNAPAYNAVLKNPAARRASAKRDGRPRSEQRKRDQLACVGQVARTRLFDLDEIGGPLRVLFHGTGSSLSSNEAVSVSGMLGAREDRVVERLHLVHGAGEALGIVLRLVVQAPVLDERLEVGERGGEQGAAIGYTSARERL